MTTRPRPHRGRGGQGGHEPRPRIRTREQRALELAVLGWPQHRIAADIGVSQAAVSKILKRIDLRTLRELMQTVERQRARQTLRLEHLYAEAIRAWDASKADATRRRQRKTHRGAGGEAATVAEMVIENRHGDPRFLEEGRKTLADLRKLWGLDAPQQFDVHARRDPYDGLSEEALRELLASQAPLLDARPVSDGVSRIPVPSKPSPVAPIPAARDRARSPERTNGDRS